MRDSVVLAALAAIVLVACGKPDSATMETVESLVVNPERLKTLREQCRLERAKLGDVLCDRVAEATRKRFYGDGKTPYTPPKDSPKF